MPTVLRRAFKAINWSNSGEISLEEFAAFWNLVPRDGATSFLATFNRRLIDTFGPKRASELFNARLTRLAPHNTKLRIAGPVAQTRIGFSLSLGDHPELAQEALSRLPEDTHVAVRINVAANSSHYGDLLTSSLQSSGLPCASEKLDDGSYLIYIGLPVPEPLVEMATAVIGGMEATLGFSSSWSFSSLGEFATTFLDLFNVELSLPTHVIPPGLLGAFLPTCEKLRSMLAHLGELDTNIHGWDEFLAGVPVEEIDGYTFVASLLKAAHDVAVARSNFPLIDADGNVRPVFSIFRLMAEQIAAGVSTAQARSVNNFFGIIVGLMVLLLERDSVQILDLDVFLSDGKGLLWKFFNYKTGDFVHFLHACQKAFSTELKAALGRRLM